MVRQVASIDCAPSTANSFCGTPGARMALHANGTHSMLRNAALAMSNTAGACGAVAGPELMTNRASSVCTQPKTPASVTAMNALESVSPTTDPPRKCVSDRATGISRPNRSTATSRVSAFSGSMRCITRSTDSSRVSGNAAISVSPFAGTARSCSRSTVNDWPSVRKIAGSKLRSKGCSIGTICAAAGALQSTVVTNATKAARNARRNSLD